MSRLTLRISRFRTPSTPRITTLVRTLLIIVMAAALMAASVLTAWAVAIDADNDGKNDNADHCLGTAAGAAVDSHGCSDAQLAALAALLDADGDGIQDNKDECSGTPAGTEVDNKGCAIGDADGDGVKDNKDDCADTPAGTEVDNKGCPETIPNHCLDENGQDDLQNKKCDQDGEGLANEDDNCDAVANAGQLDTDDDGEGDACDTDDDGDGDLDTADNCPLMVNADQANNDGDGLGDPCDPDDDNDTVSDGSDNCPTTANINQADDDGDALGDVCDADDDNDQILDGPDNCDLVANADQADSDQDGIGDACENDTDGDGIANGTDNCQLIANADQSNNDGDASGDVCDPDDDNDGVLDGPDNCDLVSNPGQADLDSDGAGDACDQTDDRPVAPVNGTNNFVSVTNVTHGATYEHGAVPTAGCLSNAGTPTLSIGAVAGPLASYGLGTQTVSCTLVGVGSAFVTYTVEDTTAPVLNLPDDITVTSGRGTVASTVRVGIALQVASAGVTWSASATDSVSGPTPVTCAPPSGSVFPTGTTTVTCSANDLVGNVGSGTFTVTVLGSGGGNGERPADDGDDVLGNIIRRGSPSGAEQGGSSLGSPNANGTLLPSTGVEGLATFVLIGFLLIGAGIGSTATARGRHDPRHLVG